MLAACADPPPDSPPDAAPEPPHGQGSEATSDLVLNEIAPRGDGPDWVELLNRSASPIDLCGYFLTDSVDRLDHYMPLGGVLPPDPCPAAPLAAGARLVVTVDDPFDLGVADEIHLVATDGIVVDGLLYLYPPGPNAPATVTLARDPDGAGLFWERPPTPGAENLP